MWARRLPPRVAGRLGPGLSALGRAPAARAHASHDHDRLARLRAKHFPKPGALQLGEDVIVEKAEGSWIQATNGRRYLDISMGIGVVALGHCHPKVVEAVREQAGLLMHGQFNIVNHKPMLELMGALTAVMPKDSGIDRFVFANAGTEAIENAVKMARLYTKRPNVVVFQGGFHGRTLGAASLTTAKYLYRAGLQPLMPGAFVAPYAYCHRCSIRRACPDVCKSKDCCGDPLLQLRNMLKQQTAPDETAAILFEPVIGEGGYIMPPVSFVQGLRQLADEHKCLLIADEVQTGYGRTGKMWGIENFGVKPDIVCIAKGIASGMPLACTATRGEIMDAQRPGSIGGTFGGNAVCSAAALAVLRVFQEEKILDNVRRRGEQFMEGLRKLVPKYPIADIRGKGLMIGVEFEDAKVGAGFAGKVQKAALKNDMIVLSAGIHETLRIIPALTISQAETEEAIRRLDKSIADVLNA